MFAGQRAEGFYVDLGSIFDLGDLRPFASAARPLRPVEIPTNGPGVNATGELNVHSIALQVPITDLTEGGWTPAQTRPTRARSIGVWTTASRQHARVYDTGPQPVRRTAARAPRSPGSATRCSTRSSSRWARRTTGTPSRPPTTSSSRPTSPTRSWPSCCPSLYPGVFPNLAALNKAGKARADLEAILLTGIPAGIVPGFQNFTGATQADMLRLNLAIPPRAEPKHLRAPRRRPGRVPQRPARLRRRATIELRAIAGATYPLVDKSYTPDARRRRVTDGLTPADLTAPLPRHLPLPGRAAQRVHHTVQLIAARFSRCPRRHGGAGRRAEQETR